MANRNFVQFSYSLNKKVVRLDATVKFNATTASPTLEQWQYGGFGGSYSGSSAPAYSSAPTAGFMGIGGGNQYPSITVPIVYNSAGNYTVYLQDRYVRLLGFQVTFQTSAAFPAAPFWQVVSTNLFPTLPTTCPSLVLQYYSTAGSATSPAQNEVHLWNILLSDSSAA